jgi:hypothetical protein
MKLSKVKTNTLSGKADVPRFIVCRGKDIKKVFVCDRTTNRRVTGTPLFDTKAEGWKYLDTTEFVPTGGQPAGDELDFIEDEEPEED